MPPELREVAEWIRKVTHDRRLAEAALTATPTRPRHCRRLKGYIAATVDRGARRELLTSTALR